MPNFLIIMTAKMDVDHEIELLKEKIKLLGVDGGDGTWTVKFGVLFNGMRYYWLLLPNCMKII